MLKNRKQTRQFICPHIDCQVSFLTPVIEKGILSCPHCERSLLVETPLGIELFNQNNINMHKKQKSLTYIWVCILLGGIVAFLQKQYGWEDMHVWIFAIGLVVSVYTAYRSTFSYRLKHKKIIFKAGADTLSGIQRFTEIKTDYVDKKGVLTQGLYPMDQMIPSDLKSCPHCTSQMMVKLPTMVDWKRDLYAKYDIARPIGIPNSGYCTAMDRYVSSDPTLSKIFLCLHCHTHYSWINIETDTLFKSAEGAPQLHKVVALQ